jgi:uncharacterized protein YdeI (YjbR/CyaY-like superfamily)
MPTTDPRLDAYIESAAAFAQPILKTLRETVHAACPTVVETIKWRMPFFVVDDRILAHMAAFKQHCGFGFWRGRSRELVEGDRRDEAMGQFGRLTTTADLPARRELVKLIRNAAAVSAAIEAQPGSKIAPSRAAAGKPPPTVPDALSAALRTNAKARTTFDKLPNSHRREYVEWIVEAKREETRARRIAQTVEWLAEGKSRNWKYEAC